ncbi:MAG: hypothetical protein ACP5HI_07125 [Caldimicrobium sp.]
MARKEPLQVVKNLNEKKFLGFADLRLTYLKGLKSLIIFKSKFPKFLLYLQSILFYRIFPGGYWTSIRTILNPIYALNGHFGMPLLKLCFRVIGKK